MSWTRASELAAQVQNLWDRGDLLRYGLQPNDLFPFKLKFKKPSSTDLSDRFENVREWIGHITALKNYRIEAREFTHRVLGKNSVPESIWINDLQNAIAIVDKQRELACFRNLADRLSVRLPELLPWVNTHPVRSLNYESDWEHLLAITDWIKRNPRPNIYLRQVDIPGLHTKFIESNASVLAEWFDIVLPSDQINYEMSARTQFSGRYGFKTKPSHIRFRLLDPTIWPAMQRSCADIAMDSASFASLDLNPRYVFITENEVNFLAFPSVQSGIVIFGKGYGWEALAKADWMKKCSIVYWGDIDTHGFAILDQLREQFPTVTSLLMDKATLMGHRDCWVDEQQQTTRHLTRLTCEEATLYDELRRNAIRSNLRFEQERISIERVRLELEKLHSRESVIE
jgi:hypothetical protein